MRYTIKAFIKEKNETVSNVASKLQLSRPTFDTYIAAYESGLKITKGRYQKIFDSLFSDYYISSDVFKERLELYHELLKSESKNETIEYLSTYLRYTLVLNFTPRQCLPLGNNAVNNYCPCSNSLCTLSYLNHMTKKKCSVTLRRAHPTFLCYETT